jgi:hypothetical protein
MPESQTDFVRMKLREIRSDLDEQPAEESPPSEPPKLIDQKPGESNRMIRKKSGLL